MDSFKDLSDGCTYEVDNPYDSLILDSKSEPVSRRNIISSLSHLVGLFWVPVHVQLYFVNPNSSLACFAHFDIVYRMFRAVIENSILPSNAFI